MYKRKLIISGAALFVAACSHSGTVSKVATDYNRGMANTRDEQLLVNILRASGREPLMFSAVGEVTGSAQDKLSLSTVGEHLLTGAKNVITPTLGLEGSSGPTVKVTPLSSKEFTEGIMQPIKPSTLAYFMNQGWDAEFLLPLVVASYRCGGEEEILDYRDATTVTGWGTDFSMKQSAAEPALKNIELTVPDDEALRLMREGGPNGYTVKSVSDVRDDSQMSKVILVAPALADVVVTVTDAEALRMMRSGVAGGYKVKAVTQGNGPDRARVVLTVPEEKNWEAVFGENEPTCPTVDAVTPDPVAATATADGQSRPRGGKGGGRPAVSKRLKVFTVTSEAAETSDSTPGGEAPSLQFRSVEGIIYYLGEAFRPCLLRWQDVCSITYNKKLDPREQTCPEEAGKAADGGTVSRTLFRVHSRGVPPPASAIHTRYNGNHYWVNRLDRCDKDRTLKTLSFVSQLIALQTNASDLVVTPSVIAVGNR